MKEIVIDMDDISLDNADANGLSYLYFLKGKFPRLKITLFLIPGRSTLAWIEELNRIPWIRLGMHGFMHDEKEEITAAQLLVMDTYTRIYKGPNWKVTEKEIELLINHKWKLAVKEKIKRPIKQWALTDPRSFHGHCWIKGDWENLRKILEQNKDIQFKFIEDII